MTDNQSRSAEPGDDRLDAAITAIFADPPGEPAPTFDLEDLLRRAMLAAGVESEDGVKESSEFDQEPAYAAAGVRDDHGATQEPDDVRRAAPSNRRGTGRGTAIRTRSPLRERFSQSKVASIIAMLATSALSAAIITLLSSKAPIDISTLAALLGVLTALLGYAARGVVDHRTLALHPSAARSLCRTRGKNAQIGPVGEFVFSNGTSDSVTDAQFYMNIRGECSPIYDELSVSYPGSVPFGEPPIAPPDDDLYLDGVGSVVLKPTARGALSSSAIWHELAEPKIDEQAGEYLRSGRALEDWLDQSAHDALQEMRESYCDARASIFGSGAHRKSTLNVKSAMDSVREQAGLYQVVSPADRNLFLAFFDGRLISTGSVEASLAICKRRPAVQRGSEMALWLAGTRWVLAKRDGAGHTVVLTYLTQPRQELPHFDGIREAFEHVTMKEKDESSNHA